MKMKIVLWVSTVAILANTEKLMPAYHPESSTELCRLLVWTARQGPCMIAAMHKRKPGVWNTTACNGSDTTPLHEVIRDGDNPSVRLLLALGANIDAQDSMGRTPLHLAVNTSSRPSIVFDLIHARARLNVRDALGDTALHVAVRMDLGSDRMRAMREDEDMKLLNTNSLLVAGARRDIENEIGESPVCIAMRENNKMAKFLLEEKVLRLRFPYEYCEDVWRHGDFCASDSMENGTDVFGRTKLIRYIISTDNDSIPDSVFEGSDINAKDIYERTALHEASRLGKLETVKFLIGKKPRINARDWLNQTPLHLASMCLREDVKRELERGGAIRNVTDRKSRTPEDIAKFVT